MTQTGGMSTEIARLREMIGQAGRIVGFTGAGVSTESGIPDFRSPGGIWTRYDPRDFEFSRYVEDPEVRRRSWQMRREFFATGARPNPAHAAFARLEREGRSPGVITQNIDGLHQDAGSRTVLELHGTAREVACIGTSPQNGVPRGCGWSAPWEWASERVEAGDADPECPQCGGLVKSATISFGQMLDEDVLERAAALARSADLLITAGSALQVHPAAGIPLEVLRGGGRLVVLNDEPTPLDDAAALVVRGRAGEVLGTAA